MPLSQDYDIKNSETKKVFYGRVPLKKASSLFYFEKGGAVQHIIHDLKYRGNEKVSEVLGSWHAQLLAESGWKSQFDWIVPVPIHKKRLRKRGFNQVDKYAEAFAKHLDAIFVKDVLLRKQKSKTQVFKNRISRTKVNYEEFYLNEKAIENEPKHILLVDDIITTGATIEACCQELLKIDNVKISIASMAFTTK